MRILFIAYGYDREGKSESATAYNIATAIRDCGHDVTILTRKPFKDPDVINVPLRTILARSPSLRKLKLDYFEFIARAYRIAKDRLGKYDLIHHISPISFRYPNPLANLDRPFIWGPVGGSIRYPPGFSALARREPFLQRARVIDEWRLRWDPLMINTMKNAVRIVTTSNAAHAILPERFKTRSVVIPYGINPANVRTDLPESEPYIFSSGRLVPYKAMDLLIQSYAACATDRAKLWISGEGPERGRLIQLIEALGLGNRVKLLGRVSHAENVSLMSGSLFCVYPALNEAFGHVNLEAMLVGKPIIVTNWGGPADIVVDGVTGYKILGKNPAEHVQLLSERIRTLLDADGARASMGKNARNHVLCNHSWPAIGRRYSGLYKMLR